MEVSLIPPVPKPSSTRGIQGWIEANNTLIYTLLTGESAEANAIDINVRMKLITQLKMRNKELRLLRINRVTDKLMDKLEAGVDSLLLNADDSDLQFIPLYLQILRSLQESAKANEVDVELGDALIFDTIQSVTETGLSEDSRDKIRTAARELLALCTTTSESSPLDSQTKS